MPKGYPILDESQKQEIISRVKKNGESVTDLAKEYGVHSKTIYQLLAKQVNQPNLILEIAKLRKEKEALLSIIGELVAEKKSAYKKTLK
jgi:lambda repressor-like predicted transcriptional regulator